MRPGAPLLAALFLAVTLPGTATAQERIVVLTEPGTPVVATHFLLSVGPVDEGEDQHGLAYLSARAVLAPIQAALDSLGAALTLTPHKDALSFSVTAAPDAWEEATRRVAVALFREPAGGEVVVGERRAIVAELRGRGANPADAATYEMDRAFFGLGHPWARPTVGTPQSVGRLTYEEVDAFLRANFTADRVVTAVAGPVDAGDAIAHLRPLLGATLPAPIEMVPFRSSRLPVRRDYDAITTWVVASYRFPERGDQEALRFVAYLAAEVLGFGPERRSVYNFSAEVVPRVGAGEIRFQVVVPPEEAPRWAELIVEAIEGLETGPMIDDVFAAHLRRYRGERLMRLISPEDRAGEAARQLLVEGRLTGLVPDLDEMTQERVRLAARSLEDPAIVLLGPILDDRQQ
jgi:predicted Zn-dependent peptidase